MLQFITVKGRRPVFQNDFLDDIAKEVLLRHNHINRDDVRLRIRARQQGLSKRFKDMCMIIELTEAQYNEKISKEADLLVK